MKFKQFAFIARGKGPVVIIGECMGVDAFHAKEHAYTQLLDTHPGV